MDPEAPAEYRAIQTDDNDQFYVGANKFKTKEKFKSKSCSVKQPLQVLGKDKEKEQETQNIIDILGQRILSMTVDTKGRVLFLFGPSGTVCLYWKTHKLFDISNVGILGQRDQNMLQTSMFANPYGDDQKKTLQQSKLQQSSMKKSTLAEQQQTQKLAQR